MIQTVKKPLVLCEGKEDKCVMNELARRAGLEGRLEFREYGGKDRLRDYLNMLKARPEYVRGEYSRILVTRDADNDFKVAWQAIKDAIFEELGCVVDAPGRWATNDESREIAAWIVPGDGRTGMIETMCVESSCGKNPKVYECLESFLGCLSGVHGGDMHQKARFFIWTIAAQGTAAKDRMSLEYAIPNLPIDWDADIFKPLRELLHTVAVEIT